MTEPLVVEFDVDAPVAHAFDVWTTKSHLWWPTSHTVTGDPAAAITFEPRAGGRIVEQAPDGTRHQWGEVIEWQPPTLLRFWWHLFFSRDEATEVEVTFRPRGGVTSIRLEQRGWERLGAAGVERRQRTGAAWALITGRYAAACAPGPAGT